MRKNLLLLLCFGLFHFSFSQQNSVPVDVPPINNYQAEFMQAYIDYPEIPQGMLEAVAFNNSRFFHITHTVNDPESCIGLPNAYGVMGLTLDGKNYFRNNLVTVSTLSGYSTQDIINDPKTNILACAKAYSVLMSNLNAQTNDIASQVPVLIALSELPDDDLQNNFALNTQLYSILYFLNKQEYQQAYGFPLYTINLATIFGEDNYKVLSSPFVIVSEKSIINKNGNHYHKSHSPGGPPSTQSTDYGPALTNLLTCNYSSRNGTSISAVTIHTVQGSYSGCIGWFHNCNAQVSAHYVARSSDGQLTQCVREYQKAWHVGSENLYTIGIEHEGYVNNPSWYTNAMYTGSAALVRDICVSSGYGINPTTCWNGPSCSGGCVKPASIHIKGHQMFPNQTHVDPGINWNWPLYYCKINNCNSGPPNPPTPASTNNACGDKTLSRPNPPSGTTYYWQGTSCGTSTGNSSSTYTCTSSGTYYLRAKSNGVWSACSSVAVTVNPVPADAPAPSTTTNQCGPQTLTHGAEPGGVDFYWQNTSCGTTTSHGHATTFSAPTTGTYYLRARTTAGCWSNNCSSVAVAVAPTPATPPTPSVSTNSCGPLTLTMGTAPAGQTYYWQGASCGIDMTNPASTTIASTSGIYYLRALSNQACWSNCSSVGVTIIDCPTNLGSSNGACPGPPVNFSWINSNNNWSLQVSLDSAFSSYFSKSAPNVTLLTAPAGFSPALTIQPNATYYWRIATGNVYTYGPPFRVPFCDIIAPTTIINPFASTWQDSSFTATFTDADDSLGSGLGKSYYRVLDFNGSEWRANTARGFANDNFDNTNLSPEWSNHAGTWATNSGFLVQSNDTLNNTNLSTALTQNLSNRYLYHWNAKIEGSGSSRKAGFYFFSDSASLPNRGNSYEVVFRIDDNKLQFYKITNDIPALVKSKNYSFTPGQFYDFKLIYNRITGKMDVYIDNTVVESWQDGSPLSSGRYVSFKTSTSSMIVNYFKTFRSRNPSVMINVGTGNNNDIRYENTSVTQSAGKIESIVNDVAGNLSTLQSSTVDVDWTAPSAIPFVNDGPGADIITTTDSTELTANWSPSADPNSGIAKYHYSIGTSPGDTSVCGSTDNLLQLLGTKSALQLIVNQIYYFNIQAENGAGMLSAVTSSNGQKYVANTINVEEEIGLTGINIYPNPFNNSTTVNYKLTKSEKIEISLFDVLGKKLTELKNEEQGAGEYKYKIDGTQLGLNKGLYLVVFKTEKTTAFVKIEFK